MTGAQDAAGNLQQDYAALPEFSIDTLNPTVTDVNVSDLLISDADTAGNFTVTRITSYNVCYTKLLRPFRVRAPLFSEVQLAVLS